MDIDVTVLFFNIAAISKHTLPESVRYQHDVVTHRDSYLTYEFLLNKPSYSTEEIFQRDTQYSCKRNSGCEIWICVCVLNSPKSGSTYIGLGLSSS